MIGGSVWTSASRLRRSGECSPGTIIFSPFVPYLTNASRVFDCRKLGGGSWMNLPKAFARGGGMGRDNSGCFAHVLSVHFTANFYNAIPKYTEMHMRRANTIAQILALFSKLSKATLAQLRNSDRRVHRSSGFPRRFRMCGRALKCCSVSAACLEAIEGISKPDCCLVVPG